MYIETVPNRNSPPCTLLREANREGGKVKKKTIANLTNWDPKIVAGLRALLKGGRVTSVEESNDFEIVRSLPHGHVAAILGEIKALKLDRLLLSRNCPEKSLALALIASRIINPQSKIATARALRAETATTTLADVLGIESFTDTELYRAMDWLLDRQPQIEATLAKRHLNDGTLVLYDLTSTYFEGHSCPLAKVGYSRDGKKGTPQIVFGLLTDSTGCPVAVEVFDGNTADAKTVSSQIQKIRGRFGLSRVVLVGDRGMLTDARIREDLRPIEGFEWITALRNTQIRKLIVNKSFQLSFFDEKDIAEISDPDFPGERLIVCRNPLLATERARKRKELLEATEKELEKIVQATKREKRTLKGKEKIAIRVGKVIPKYKMEKHFCFEIDENSFIYTRDEEKIAQESSLDGIYIIRTNVAPERMKEKDAVKAYKNLAAVERAFRCIKTVDLEVRPIYHRLPDRVRSHIFICMLAYYVEWHLKKKLETILFEDHEKDIASELRQSIVAPSKRSPAAQKKVQKKRTRDDLPVLSYKEVLRYLSTIVKNTIQPRLKGAMAFYKVTHPTTLQQRILDLLGTKLDCTQ